MKKLLLLFLLIAFSFSLAQETDSIKVETKTKATEKSEYKQSKIYYGGGIGFSFWGDSFRISVETMVGYKFTPKLSGGIKLVYEYINDSRSSLTTTWHNYGGSLLLRYRIIPQVYAHAEYAYMSYQATVGDHTGDRNWVPFLLLGGGYSQLIGGNTWAYVQILFDVIQDDDSPYNTSDPFISLGVSVGF